jgi:hypothetical protein
MIASSITATGTSVLNKSKIQGAYEFLFSSLDANTTATTKDTYIIIVITTDV